MDGNTVESVASFVYHGIWHFTVSDGQCRPDLTHRIGLACAVLMSLKRGPDISPPATSPPGHEPAGHEPAGHEPATGGSQARQRWVKSPPNHELVLACTGKI